MCEYFIFHIFSLRCKADYDVHVHGMVPLWDFILLWDAGCTTRCCNNNDGYPFHIFPKGGKGGPWPQLTSEKDWEVRLPGIHREAVPQPVEQPSPWTFPRPLFALQVHLHVKVRIQHLAKVTGTERFHPRVQPIWKNQKISKISKNLRDIHPVPSTVRSPCTGDMCAVWIHVEEDMMDSDTERPDGLPPQPHPQKFGNGKCHVCVGHIMLDNNR